MRTLLKLRWVFVLLWAVALTVLLMFQPNMSQLVRDKGNITVPGGYSSMDAKDILKRHSTEDAKTITGTLVFHDKKGMDAADEAEIKQVIQALEDKKEKLGIIQITSFADNEEIRKQVISKDNKTILVPVEIDPQKRKVAEIRTQLQDTIGKTKVEHYLTGESFISEDVVASSQEGLHKTEVITVVFILLVLVIVFRSLVAPLIPLITVGLAYAGSAAVVAYLVDWFNFPLSNFTQIFMVAILFGIGTDYCILLLSRFKEELPKHETVTDAIVKTYQTAGKTVFFSALAVLIGFASIGLSKFSLYRSATGVAIGILVMLIAFATIVPFFMAVLGPKLFWPAKNIADHSDSKIWGFLGSFSLTKPFRALLVVAVIIVPLFISYKGNLSFNSLNEIGEGYDSVKGFNTIADSFGPGEIMPVQVVIESKKNLNNGEGLAAIEKVSEELSKVNGVAKVRSASRPLGEEVKDFTVSEQAKKLSDGLGQGKDGLGQIGSGLTEAKNGLASNAPKLQQAVDGVGKLADGTKTVIENLNKVQTGLQAIAKGLQDGSMGAGELKKGVTQMREQMEAAGSQTGAMVTSYQQLASSLQQLSGGYGQIAGGLEAIQGPLNALNGAFTRLEAQPGFGTFAATADYQQIKGTALGAQQTVNSLLDPKQGLPALNAGLQQAADGVTAGQAQIEASVKGQQQLVAGLRQIETGLDKLATGLNQGAAGQVQIVNGVPQLVGGLSKIEDGQRQTKDGFGQLVSQLQTLTDGLGKSVDGIQKVSDGLTQAKDYLGNLSTAENAGFYVPSQAFENSEFQQVFDRYLSKDSKVAKFDVILKYNPYNMKSLDTAKTIKGTVERSLKGTGLEGATYGVTGASAISSDLLAASDRDYTQTVVYMLVGIGLILVLLLRSLVMPLYLIVSLVLCFYSSLALNEVIFVRILGYDGLNWTMPFFGFVLLMALGVDYSIFLMDRFNEYKGMPVAQAMLQAMRNMGTVIFSAVIILGGTFAAMYPAGVLSLAQIATIVLVGLLLYALVFLPFFVPAMVKLFGRANWFPFDRSQEVYKKDDVSM
ncbi:MMPL family transporter [Ectobacillus ponti]|uniref:MMPL family transporter n=1 Tax=Ectobacillus ponti TaxID=2961894 RepID=A0AA42BNI9_9BACI|nr:MMPL family transporter [Ectobacillus ponti]MCP8968035.1 MMPL family transporter [Ectobacillus ponti]